VGIDISGINKIDAGIDGSMNNFYTIVMIGVAHFPEHHGAETETAYP